MAERPTSRLRALIARGAPILMPFAFDAVSARVMEEAGFEAIGTSGSNIAASLLGVPDIALTTMTEMADHNARIAGAVDLPIIADADNGYGKALNVRRTVQEYERAGLAGLFFEDQTHPKRCGHYEGVRVISVDEMVAKIRAAVETRRDPDFVIVARTDARASLGLDEAIARGLRYAAVGADVIFVEAPRTAGEMAEIARRITTPLLVNMVEGGKTPILPLAELGRLGYRIVIYADTAMTAAVFAMRAAMAALKRDGDTRAVADRLVPFADLNRRLLRLDDYAKLEARYETP